MTFEGFDGVLKNITVEFLNHSWATVVWSSPCHGISQYILNINPLPNSGICASGHCMVDTEYITVTGLELSTNYTLTIMASACHILSQAVTTFLFFSGNGWHSCKLYIWPLNSVLFLYVLATLQDITTRSSLYDPSLIVLTKNTVQSMETIMYTKKGQLYNWGYILCITM